ncbi:MAG: YdcF family protein [Deltaproteobacteria bacterium]|nr:YdcF family protein [Deltaproteobacteria bacterium]
MLYITVRSRLKQAGLLLGISLLCTMLGIAARYSLLGARVEPGPLPSDVIVVLAGEPTRDRYATALVAQGVAPRVLSTLVDPQCVRAGRLPQVCASGVRSTVDEALLMHTELAAERVQQVTVVTSNYHTLRAAVIFRIVFIGSGIQVSMVAPPGPPPDSRNIISEVKKFFPSVGAAIIGRLSPALYQRIAQQFRGETRL